VLLAGAGAASDDPPPQATIPEVAAIEIEKNSAARFMMNPLSNSFRSAAVT
jgi:hypothetical protein